MILFDDLYLSYGCRPILSGVTLHAAPGQRIALMGPSGCGKTSMLRLAAGLARPVSGTVRCRAKRLAYAFQEPRLLPWLTAAENVSAVLDAGDALRWLDAVGLTGAADKLPRELSGGMAQRVNLARALARDGDLLLLDEPLKELDKTLREDMLALLDRCSAGRTLLVTTHDIRVARTLADRILLFRGGTFVPAE